MSAPPRQVAPELSELPELATGGPLARQVKDLNRFLDAREETLPRESDRNETGRPWNLPEFRRNLQKGAPPMSVSSNEENSA